MRELCIFRGSIFRIGEESGGLGGNAFAATGEPKSLGSGGFNGNAINGEHKVVSHVLYHLRNVGEEFGRLGDDCNIYVDRCEASFFVNDAECFAQ